MDNLGKVSEIRYCEPYHIHFLVKPLQSEQIKFGDLAKDILLDACYHIGVAVK